MTQQELDDMNEQLSRKARESYLSNNILPSIGTPLRGIQTQPRILIPKEAAAYSVLGALGFKWVDGQGWVKQ